MINMIEIWMRHFFIRLQGFTLTLILVLLLTGCSNGVTPISEPSEPDPPQAHADLEVIDPTHTPGEIGESSAAIEVEDLALTSPAFAEGDPIPVQYTCDGDDLSPALSWGGIPEGTESFALIMDDPDAPGGTWVHWILFNLPGDTTELPVSVPAEGILSDGSVHGVNSWGRRDYGGPCPPQGTHRYFFKLYALDISLDGLEGVDVQALYDTMEGHILAEAEYMGTYTR